MEFCEIGKSAKYVEMLHTLRANLNTADVETEKVSIMHACFFITNVGDHFLIHFLYSYQLHEQEELLGLTRMEFYLLDDTRRSMEPYEQLWSLAGMWGMRTTILTTF